LAGIGEEGIVEEIWKEPQGAGVTVLLKVDLMGVVTSGVHLRRGRAILAYAIRDKAISDSISPEGDVVLIPVGVNETSNIRPRSK
jgi:hypothetical protein